MIITQIFSRYYIVLSKNFIESIVNITDFAFENLKKND